ncbi:TPA: hypothetical protein ACOEQH_000444 [Stenotrophomonas maltophilia]
MDAIEKRAREPNPNVAVIHEAMQHFPEGSWMRGALDHAAAELAVLHGRCQRTALTLPKGYVLVPSVLPEKMLDALYCAEGDMCDDDMQKLWKQLLAARPEVKP